VNWEHKGKTMPRPNETKNNNSQITSVLKAISNMRRLQILNELADGREKSVLELEKVVPDLSQSALSQHLG
jgi:DNA-binding transcriptional ArsR family regulator